MQILYGSIILALRHLLQNNAYGEVCYKFLYGEKSLEYHWFKMERESFLFVFGRRLKNNKMMGTTIKGLEETIKKIRESASLIILSHTLEAESDTVLIYTDEKVVTLFGVVEPSK
jgi:hypothetical protein